MFLSDTKIKIIEKENVLKTRQRTLFYQSFSENYQMIIRLIILSSLFILSLNKTYKNVTLDLLHYDILNVEFQDEFCNKVYCYGKIHFIFIKNDLNITYPATISVTEKSLIQTRSMCSYVGFDDLNVYASLITKG